VAERVGILGGTFDPPHLGHTALAHGVRRALGLDRVLLMVANVPWQKTADQVVTPAEDRFAMAVAAVADEEGLDASRLELDRGGVTYTVDSLEQLHRERPGDELFLIVGSDVVARLASWHRADELDTLCAIVAVVRPGAPRNDRPGVQWVDVVTPDVSSTAIRARVAAGESIDGLVAPAVAEYIANHGVYRRAGLRNPGA
jgi:nicotinate-nucleotide adenylyltransferase